MIRLVSALLVAAVAAMALWAGSGSPTCADVQPARHHPTSVERVERCAAAGFHALVSR
jgi:hypothetical protein